MQTRDDLLSKLDEAVSELDRLESLLTRIKPGEQVQPGLVYQIYESMVLLREKILETRLLILKSQGD